MARSTPRSVSRSRSPRDALRRRGHDERRRIATRLSVGVARDLHEIAKARTAGHVHAVTRPTGELGHLRAEASDDHRRWRLRTQEPTRAAELPRPHGPHARDRFLDRPAASLRRPAPRVPRPPAPPRTACRGPRPRRCRAASRPSLTSCSVAAITASVPGSRLATLSTSGPIARRGTAAAIAVSVVQHSKHAVRPRGPTRPDGRRATGRRSPLPRPRAAPSRTSLQCASNGSNRTSINTCARYNEPGGVPSATSMTEQLRILRRRRHASPNARPLPTHAMTPPPTATSRRNMNQTARGLAALGVVPGDTIAVVMSNRRELLEIYGAAIQTGLTFVAINWHLGETEIAYILEDSGAKVLIVDGQFADSARPAADRVSLPESSRFSVDDVCGLPSVRGTARRTLRGHASRSARGPDHVLHVGHDRTAQGSAQAVPGHEP